MVRAKKEDLTFKPEVASSPNNADVQDIQEAFALMKENAIVELNRLSNEMIMELEALYNNCLNSLAPILHMPFHNSEGCSTMLELVEKKLAELPSSTNGMHDDLGSPDKTRIISTRRSRSVARDAPELMNSSTRNRPRSADSTSQFVKQHLVTPFSQGGKIAQVTPCPNVGMATSVLRMPQTGEIAISLAGSPLIVTNNQGSQLPQLSIPLEDGRVFAIRPTNGLQNASLPELNNETYQKLKVLNDFLSMKIRKSDNE